MGRVGLKTIAEDAGVHPSTVSLAMRNDERIPPATRDRIQAIAAKLDYRPNYFARGLRGQRTNSVGILVSRLRDPYVVDVLDAQEKYLRQRQYLPLLAVTDANPEDEIKVLEDLAARGIDGLVFDYTPTHPKTLAFISGFVKEGKPVSVLGQCGKLAGVDEVDVDIESSSCEVTRHLLALGHRQICLIGLGADDSRELGYRRAYREADVELDASLILRGSDAHADAESLLADMQSRDEPPTAVFAFNDGLAIELMTRLVRCGYDVPGDISIVGVNDDWYSASVLVPLTTIRLNPHKSGEALVRMVLQRMRDSRIKPRRLIVSGELVLRQSMAPPRQWALGPNSQRKGHSSASQPA